jgi:hypothetical protein
MNQQQKITELLEIHLNGNHTIIQIYDIIVKKLKVPRPTVRREARNLRITYENRLRILEQNKNEKMKIIPPQKEKVWFER